MSIHGETLVWKTYRDDAGKGMSEFTTVNSTEKHPGNTEPRSKFRKAASNTEIPQSTVDFIRIKSPLLRFFIFSGLLYLQK